MKLPANDERITDHLFLSLIRIRIPYYAMVVRIDVGSEVADVSDSKLPEGGIGIETAPGHGLFRA